MEAENRNGREQLNNSFEQALKIRDLCLADYTEEGSENV
jgi:hypothetical protein